MARHDLVLVGSGTLGLKYDRQPPGLADGFTPESVGVARERIQRFSGSSKKMGAVLPFQLLFGAMLRGLARWVAGFGRVAHSPVVGRVRVVGFFLCIES